MSAYKDTQEKDLRELLETKRKKLLNVRLGMNSSNGKEVSILRKDIARILTELNARNK